jgi:hypothetical protein
LRFSPLQLNSKKKIVSQAPQIWWCRF